MLTRNLGLIVLLLFAVVGHSQLLDLALGPPQQRPSPLKELGFAFIFAPIALVMLGEWIAQDSETAAWRRRGYLLAVVGGVWHLLLDAACLALPWLDVSSPWFSIAGALLGAVVMGLVVQASWRGLVTPFAEPPDLSQAPYNDPRVIITPHVAFYSSQATEELRTRVGRQAVAFLRGERPENIVNPAVIS